MFSAMVALAIVPDASTMAVAARSLSSGFKQGIVVIAGIITGDLIFILFAVFGLAAVAEVMDGLFVFIRYLGALFLIYLAVTLCWEKPNSVELDGIKEASTQTNFISGLLITLGDPKAILFYISFLPVFMDLSKFRMIDVGIVLATAIAALCCTKLIYAFMADKSRSLFKSKKAKRGMNIVAGLVMFTTAIFLVIKA